LPRCYWKDLEVAVELGALNIDFNPRTAIKSHALVDFMAEAGKSATYSN
jgi:hypothetical protein